MNLFVIITVLSVSIDSMVCGFSLAFLKGNKTFIPIIVALTVFAMCLLTNYATLLFTNLLNEKIASLSGIILILIGLVNLLKKVEPIKNNSTHLVKQSFITAFAVGVDGAFANFSLAILGFNSFFVPLSIGLTHAVAVVIGIALSKTKLMQKFGAISFIPPLILIMLGFYKLLGFFI